LQGEEFDSSKRNKFARLSPGTPAAAPARLVPPATLLESTEEHAPSSDALARQRDLTAWEPVAAFPFEENDSTRNDWLFDPERRPSSSELFQMALSPNSTNYIVEKSALRNERDNVVGAILSADPKGRIRELYSQAEKLTMLKCILNTKVRLTELRTAEGLDPLRIRSGSEMGPSEMGTVELPKAPISRPDLFTNTDFPSKRLMKAVYGPGSTDWKWERAALGAEYQIVTTMLAYHDPQNAVQALLYELKEVDRLIAVLAQNKPMAESTEINSGASSARTSRAF
jgi:hypothetical protein